MLPIRLQDSIVGRRRPAQLSTFGGLSTFVSWDYGLEQTLTLTMIHCSLASQPYFSFISDGRSERERKIRLDTLASFPWTSALMHEVQIWLVCSKLSTWLPACQSVYYSLTIAFYDIDIAFGFILHRRMTGTSRVQEQHQDDLLLNSQVAGSRVCGRSSSRWNYRRRPLSRRLFFQRVLAGSFWMSSLSRQFASVGTSFTKQ